MGTRLTRTASGVMVAVGCLALWSAPAFGAATAAGANPDATKASGDETAAARIEKQIASIQARLATLRQEELTVSLAAMKAQQAAQGTEDPNKIRAELAKGNHKREYLEYKAVCENAAQQYQALAEKHLRVAGMVKALERDREKAPAELQPRLDELSNRAQDKYRSLLEKAVDYYDKCANFKSAIQTYQSLYQSLPEDKRDRTLKEKIADLYEKAGDLQNATALYKSIFDSIPEKERFADRNLCQKLSALYEKAGDLRSAILIYKSLLDSIPEKERFGDKDLCQKLSTLYEKAGDLRSAIRIYEGLWDATPPNKRGKDRGLGEKLGDLLENAGDPRSALELYKVCYESIPADKRETDSKSLRDKIYNLEVKLGLRKGAPVPTGSPNDGDRKKYGKRR